MRVADAQRSVRVEASHKRKLIPLGNGYSKYYPTVCIALNLEIPDELFKNANAEMNLKIEKARTATEIKVLED